MTKEADIFFLPIVDSFHIDGVGTVVTGRVKAGYLNTGEEVFIFNPSGRKYKTACKGIEMFRKIETHCEIEDNVGILLNNIMPDAIEAGAWLQKGDTAIIHSNPAGIQ